MSLIKPLLGPARSGVAGAARRIESPGLNGPPARWSPESRWRPTPTQRALARIYAENADSPWSVFNRSLRTYVPQRVATEAELAGVTRVSFGETGAPVVPVLRAGDTVAIQYHPRRSPRTGRGSGVDGFVQFLDGQGHVLGPTHEAPVVAFPNQAGRVGAEGVASPMVFRVPDDAVEVVAWFRQFAGPEHVSWDNNGAAFRNYRFAVTR